MNNEYALDHNIVDCVIFFVAADDWWCFTRLIKFTSHILDFYVSANYSNAFINVENVTGKLAKHTSLSIFLRFKLMAILPFDLIFD